MGRLSRQGVCYFPTPTDFEKFLRHRCRIVTPTIIEDISFKAWLEEASSIWSEWQRVYPPRSPTAKLLQEIREDVWLVNIIHHGYMKKDALWKLLLED